MKLAIVGSVSFVNPYGRETAIAMIREVLLRKMPTLVISGGAEGVDTWTKEIAENMGFSVREWLPRNRRWQPDGFKDRNILIARDCDELVAIRDKQSKTYGSGWTADYTERLGKPVQRILL